MAVHTVHAPRQITWQTRFLSPHQSIFDLEQDVSDYLSSYEKAFSGFTLSNPLSYPTRTTFSPLPSLVLFLTLKISKIIKKNYRPAWIIRDYQIFHHTHHHSDLIKDDQFDPCTLPNIGHSYYLPHSRHKLF